MADDWSKSGSLYRRNPLVYPSGAAPGFDPAHVAAQNCPFSGVATNGGTFSHVLSRVKGTEGGTKTTSLYNSLGLVTNYPAGGPGTENTVFPFISAASAPITLAGIFKKTGTPPASTQYLLNNAAVGAVGIGDVNADGTFGGFHETAGTQTVTTGVSYVLERPYFFAMSFSITLINWVVVRLDTGQTWSAQVANTTGIIDAGDGTITVGSRSGANRQLDGSVAAAMASNAFMSQQELQTWAGDPWAFWYPRDSLNLVNLEPVPVSTSNFTLFSAPYDDSRTVTQMLGY